jgi:hypothetical protein
VSSSLRGATLAGVMLLTHGNGKRLHAQTAPAARTDAGITFAFERAGLPVPKYSLSVNENGTGMYKATDGSANIESGFTITSGTATKVFALLRDVRLAPAVCDSKAKNIADTGTKTLTYVAGESSATCSYNFSENKYIEQLTAIFEGIAETLDEGRELERLHRFDRLGLDAEMISFSEEVAANRALEVATIGDTLRSIADDPQVIQRVRTRAEKLLAMAPVKAASR